MGLYDKHILPAVIDGAMSTKPITFQRFKVVPRAQGRVLEVGFGAGHNLPFYNPAKVSHLWALEPAPEMRARAQGRVAAARLPVEFLALDAEAIPLDDESVDTVVVTYTLCSIPDVATALGQMRRVLKPAGKLLFAEHGEAPDKDVRRWQRALTPVWGMVCGGCQVGRPIPKLIAEAGFRIADLQTMYLADTWRPMGFNYWGSAAKA